MNGVPSLHFTPLRMVRVSFVKPLFQLDPVASQGVTFGVPSGLVCRMFTNSRGS